METIGKKTSDTKLKSNTLERQAIITGLIMCFCYIIYFLIMESVGLAAIPEYRIANFIIQIAAVSISIKLYKASTKGNFNYLEGFILGCFSSFISAVLFAAFIYIYLHKINPGLLQSLMDHSSMMGKYLTPFSAALTVTLEGSIAGLIISFAFMQFFKDDGLHNPLKRKSNEIE
ncbi:MAG: DUF4199 domain-containing protein [Bacteroidota bacterium]